MLKKILLSAMLLTFTVSLSAQDLKPIKLPPPQLDGGKTLMLSLKERKSTRSFSTIKLPLNVLSDLLWAACGINRPETWEAYRAVRLELAGDRHLCGHIRRSLSL